MRAFARLFAEVDGSTRTTDKVAALERYFAAADPGDAAWALSLLTGKTKIRSVGSRLLREWVAEETCLPVWLVEECHRHVGDLSETLSLLLPGTGGTDLHLRVIVEDRLLPLEVVAETRKREIITRTWRELDRPQCFLFHKLISRNFRVGVSHKLIVRALAGVAGLDPAVMAHRLLDSWEPTAESFGALISDRTLERDISCPYPFFLAQPLQRDPATLGPIEEWSVEWKWDGIRAQLIKRRQEIVLWSRGEELISDAYPEIAAAARAIPDGVVLDGEILAWSGDRPLPFQVLQRRVGRKRYEPTLWDEHQIVFMAYDLLESDERDRRQRPLAERRALLEQVLEHGDAAVLRLSPQLTLRDWGEVRARHEQAADCGAEGLMLKKLSSPYGVGRQTGPWWKWKVDPFHLDAVLMYAEPGSGRRAGLLTDYTLGVWSGGELVPVAKAYSGLSDDEIREVDRLIRRHTVGRHGPVREVEPRLVFELAFEGIQQSSRHRCGLALRFPRMARWRRDKKPEQADHLEALTALLKVKEP